MDEQRAEAFAESLLVMLNKASLSLMVSIGHRTGLFDTMATLPPSTIKEIAKKAGLNERYVREWIGAMFTGGIVECDAMGREWHLPPEHAAFLTRAASPDNIAAFAQYTAVLGSVEDKIVDCFRKGGGVPYEEFPRFHAVMAEDSGQTVLPVVVDMILPLAPGLVEAMKAGIEVMDIGCGSGRAMNKMAEHFPASKFYGVDLSEQAISTALSEARSHNLPNVLFEAKDIMKMPISGKFDLITAFDAIHDQVNPAGVLGVIAASLKPTGTFLMQDISGSSEIHKNKEHPVGPFLYTVSCMHCMTVSLAHNGAGLGAMWGEEKALEMLDAAGFSDVQVHRLSHDFQNAFYVARKG